MRFREPFNAWSHLVGLVLAAAGTGLLLTRADTPSRLLAFAVYGGSLILLYAASTLYHGLHLSPRQLRSFRTLDHIAIYFLIAGILALTGKKSLSKMGPPEKTIETLKDDASWAKHPTVAPTRRT